MKIKTYPFELKEVSKRNKQSARERERERKRERHYNRKFLESYENKQYVIFLINILIGILNNEYIQYSIFHDIFL